MTRTTRTAGYLSRWSHPVAALMLIGASAALNTPAHADPGDFQAMPGLWKITLHTLRDGRTGAATTTWKCLYDGGDPWTTFVDAMQPEADCHRAGEHRTSTALAWNVSCGAHTGKGHITLDSPQHYTGDVALDGKTTLQIEGQRYAACTGPSD